MFEQPKEISGSGNLAAGRRKQGPRMCEVCGCRVWPHRMGKHLVSHYHFSRLQRNGQSDLSREQILANISAIVKLSPFQCALCKYYCNTQESFVNHWTSELHRENDAKVSFLISCNQLILFYSINAEFIRVFNARSVELSR